MNITKATLAALSTTVLISTSLVSSIPIAQASTTCSTSSVTEGSYTIETVSPSGPSPFTTSNTLCTWTIPAGVTSLDILLVAGGGGGGRSNSGGNGGAGGGGGEVSQLQGQDVSGLQSISVQIGSAGAKAISATPAVSGGDSSVDIGSTLLSAVGGGAGGSYYPLSVNGTAKGGSSGSFTGGDRSADNALGGQGASAGSNGLSGGEPGYNQAGQGVVPTLFSNSVDAFGFGRGGGGGGNGVTSARATSAGAGGSPGQDGRPGIVIFRYSTPGQSVAPIVTFSSVVGGSATATPGASASEPISLLATAAAGYTFTSWTCASGTLNSATANPASLSGLSADTVCTPSFALETNNQEDPSNDPQDPTISDSPNQGSNQLSSGGGASTPLVIDVLPKQVAVTSEVVTIFGVLLDGFTGATINGRPVQIVKVTANTFAFRAPAGLTGTHDIILTGPGRNLVVPNGLSFASSIEAGARTVVPGFAANSTRLTKEMRKEVRAFLRTNPGLNEVVCRGFTSAPATPQDRALARDRGKATCDLIKKIRPEATVTLRSGSHTDKPGLKIRRVQITLR